MLILIGSRALANRCDIKQIRPQTKFIDGDVIGSYEEVVEVFKDLPVKYPIQKGKKFVLRSDSLIVEAELAWEDSTAYQFQQLVLSESDTVTVPNWQVTQEELAVPSLDLLYLLKMSHRYLKNSPHFHKTMRDIQFMRGLGAKIRPEHKEFYKARQKETYWYKHPKLNTDKDSFFTDDVPYKYDHDDIHKAIAMGPIPAYRLYMKEGAEVDCDKDKFKSLELYQKLFGVLEEAYTLALERHQIPNDYKPDPNISFKIALMKVCTSITSGWFREFAWEHYDRVMELYNAVNNHQSSDTNYVTKFKAALAAGKVKPYTKGY